MARGDDVVALARSDEAAAALQAAAPRVARRLSTRTRWCAAWRAPSWPSTSPASTRSASRIPSRCGASTSTARWRPCAPPPRPRAAPGSHLPRPPTLGEPPGTGRPRGTPHRGWYLSTYERTKPEGEHAVLAAAARDRPGVVCVNPSSVQGPGRAGGTGRFLLAFLDGRMKVFVPDHLSLVDIADCVEATCSPPSVGRPASATCSMGDARPGRGFALAAEVAGVPRTPAACRGRWPRRRGRRRARPPPRPGPSVDLREMVRTLLHGHRSDGSRAERELACASPTRPRPCAAVDGRDRPGLLKNVSRRLLAVERRRARRALLSRSETSSARSPGSRPPWPPWPFLAAFFGGSRNCSAFLGRRLLDQRLVDGARLIEYLLARIPAFGLNPPNGL